MLSGLVPLTSVVKNMSFLFGEIIEENLCVVLVLPVIKEDLEWLASFIDSRFPNFGALGFPKEYSTLSSART